MKYRIKTNFCRTHIVTSDNPHEAFNQLELAALVSGRPSLSPFVNFRINSASQDFPWGRRYFSRDSKQIIDVEKL